ncbi:MAG TPA: hypothetical protein VED17_10475 [Nitrososphaerales archaeon]|nr:hypothetical protein [Nitrososphaerales archaeon]
MEDPDDDTRKLLGEFGLLSQDSKTFIEARINELNMRQLDRLKLMLGRVDQKKNLFSEQTRKGIRGNDFACFTEAVLTLNSLLK